MRTDGVFTIVARREGHSKADAQALFDSTLWEKIVASIDGAIEKTRVQLELASEPLQIYRLQGRIEGLKMLRRIPDSVLGTFEAKQ